MCGVDSFAKVPKRRSQRYLKARTVGVLGGPHQVRGTIGVMRVVHPLSAALAPRSVALVGATAREGALGRHVLSNVLSGGYQGAVWPVNPKYRQVMGLPCFASLQELPAVPDLLIVVTPARTVPEVIEAAGQLGVRAALVLTAGFAESGPEGQALQARMLDRARAVGMRILGPNCLGLLRPSLGLNATFARCGAKAGSVALVAQSGAVVASALDYAAGAGFGFSTVVSTGSGADVDFSDVLDFLALDSETRSIVLYIEGVRDARALMSSVRAAASAKPVVVLKVGRHRAGSQAALSHTGALAGNDAVFAAALRQAGAIRVHAFDQLFGAAQTLAAARLPQVRSGAARLAVITNGGGPGVMAADAVVDNGTHGVELARLSETAVRKLDALLPVCWSGGNPVDIVGDADAARFVGALQVLIDDEANDGVLVLFCPTLGLGAQDAAQALLPPVQNTAKPVIVAWLGGEDARRGRLVFGAAGLPTAVSPERGVELFSYLAAFVRHQQLRLQVPPPLESSAAQPAGLTRPFHQGRGRCADAGASGIAPEACSPMPYPRPYQDSPGCMGEHLSASPRSPDDPNWPSDSCHETASSEREKIHQQGRPDEISGLERARDLIAHARRAGRVWLNELEAKQVLAALGIAVTPTQKATTADEAVAWAQRMGFPVVLKVWAEGMTHKSEVGGVMLDLTDDAAVRNAFATVRTRLAERAAQARFQGVWVQPMVRKPQGRELIAGIAHDPIFGPVLSFGSGGVMVEVQRDTALALPPLNRVLARDLISRTRVARALDAFRGAPPVALEALLDVLLRLSDLACELPAVQELDINPLLADDAGVVALDARIRIAPERPLRPDLRYSHLAIHPYPRQLEQRITVKGGTLLLRPIRPEDGQAERLFIERLSARTLYLRFHTPIKELSHERLVRFTQIDYDREMALVAIDHSAEGREFIRGIARYTRDAQGQGACEFGLTVEDAWQGRGVGTALLSALQAHAQRVGLHEIYGLVLSDNDAMAKLLTAHGYVARREDGAVLRWSKLLSG